MYLTHEKIKAIVKCWLKEECVAKIENHPGRKKENLKLSQVAGS
jgi:hypothetical protein